jgi:hypothetical protein
MMAITHEDDFVSRAAGEWRNSSKRVIAIIINHCLRFVHEVKILHFTQYVSLRIYTY